MCTATLVTDQPSGDARFVLTAAHCVGWRSGEEPTINAGITFQVGGRSYEVVRQRSWLQTANPRNDRAGAERLRDIALLELRTPVETSVARPASIATSRPAREEVVSLFGYGCTDRCGGPDESDNPSKRVARVPYGRSTFNLCPGDSGGPTLSSSGALLRINSAFFSRTQNNVFGDVVSHADEILGQMRAWRATPYVAGPQRTIDQATSCETCVTSGTGGATGGTGLWCPATSQCYSFAALAEQRCGTTPIVKFAEDCRRTDEVGQDVVGTYCRLGTDCRSCQSMYNCLWTDSGCVDSPDGSPPRGIRTQMPRWNVLCCPGPVCNGDGRCDRKRGESNETCPAECTSRPVCDQDGMCESGEGETTDECFTDCVAQPSCNDDGICEPDDGEWCGTCGDCVCASSCDSDGRCERPQGETERTCAADCPIGPVVCNGDGDCDEGEDSVLCRSDCRPQACNGDGDCDEEQGESAMTCPNECPTMEPNPMDPCAVPHCMTVLGMCTPVGGEGFCDSVCSEADRSRYSGQRIGRPCVCEMGSGEMPEWRDKGTHTECAPIGTDTERMEVPTTAGGCAVADEADDGLAQSLPAFLALLGMLWSRRRRLRVK